jgi:hypothetical protein
MTANDVLSTRLLLIAAVAWSISAPTTAEMIDIVSPSTNEQAEGDLTFANTGGPGHLQYLFLAEDFASLPSSHRLIVALNARADTGQSEAVDWTFSEEKIWMSTTSKDSLTGDFVADHGPDKRLVFDGTFTFPIVVTGEPGAPRDFAPGMPLQTPFYYDPSQGNLLVEAYSPSNSNPFPGPKIDAQSTLEARLAVPGEPSNLSAILNFTFVPEPSSLAITGLLASGLIVARRVRRVCAFVVALILASTPLVRCADAEMILIDDFNDGDDIGWQRIDTTIGQPWGPGMIDPMSGSYRFSGAGDVPMGERGILLSINEDSVDPSFNDGYLRADLRAENDTLPYLVMRGDVATFTAYVFGANPSAGRFFWNKVVNNVIVEAGPTIEPDPPLAIGEAWTVEAGIVGDQLSMKAWRLGDPEPAFPQWTHADSTIAAGQFGVGANHWSDLGPSTVNATFDNVFFTPVPEPTSLALAALVLTPISVSLCRRTGQQRSLIR